MLSRSLACLLKARPKNVSIEPGSNRFLPPEVLTKAKDIFAIPQYPVKTVMHNWRFFIKAGKATTGPPVGQEFSKIGLKVMDFSKSFNDRTKPLFKDDIELVVRIQVYFDKSYLYRIEPPPTAWFIMRAVRKKRGQTGSAPQRGYFCCLMTLEMCYEIAKMRQQSWGKLEYPFLEVRARRVACQARRMGIAIIGVDTPYDSPHKDITERAYKESCAKYRAMHMEQYNVLKAKELEEAPLIERLHRPNFTPLTNTQIEEGLQDANLFNALWRASHPRSEYLTNLKSHEMALKYLNTRGWFKQMTPDEARVIFLNYRLPELERKRQLSHHHPLYNENNSDSSTAGSQFYWTRDNDI